MTKNVLFLSILLTLPPAASAKAAEHGVLGVFLNDQQPGAAGVEITGVYVGGPAATAGLRPGDRMLAIDGQRVSDHLAVMRLIAAKSPGATVSLDVLRSQSVLRKDWRVQNSNNWLVRNQWQLTRRVQLAGPQVFQASQFTLADENLATPTGPLQEGPGFEWPRRALWGGSYLPGW